MLSERKAVNVACQCLRGGWITINAQLQCIMRGHGNAHLLEIRVARGVCALEHDRSDAVCDAVEAPVI